MKQNNLKLIIKKMVKECLTEILAEEFIRHNVIKAINEANESFKEPIKQLHKPVITENNYLSNQNNNDKSLMVAKRKEILNNMFGLKQNNDDNPYAEIFNQTMESSHPILKEKKGLQIDDDSGDEGIPLDFIMKKGFIK